MKKEITAKRLSLALSNANMKPQELADKSGVNKASISQYINGSHSPSNISSGKMAKILKVNPLWLMGFDVPMELTIKTSHMKINPLTENVYVTGDGQLHKFQTKIKVLGHVAAGIPIEAIEDIIDIEEITEDLARTGTFFGLKIKGDSMAPAICNGDVVIVRQQNDAENGEIVIATVNGNEATCKRLRKYATGIELISNNPSYDTFEFSNEDIIEKPVTIIGKVIELRRKF